MLKIKLLIPKPYPPPCDFHSVPNFSKGYHHSPIISPLESGSKTCLDHLIYPPLCDNHLLFKPPSSLAQTTSVACHQLAVSPVVIITFSNLTWVTAHLYFKCSNGFQFPLKQNSNTVRLQRSRWSGSWLFLQPTSYHSPLKILPQSPTPMMWRLRIRKDTSAVEVLLEEQGVPAPHLAP